MANKNEKEIVVKIEGADWEKALDEAFKKANKKAKIAGFRPGKAPKNVYIKHYGKESLYYEASNKAIEMAYDKVLEDNRDLDIVSEPVVAIENIDDNGITYKFTLTLKPEVKLGKYKGLKVKKEKVEVTKEEINHSIDHMREHYKENVSKDGKVENGDIAVIDFEGFKDGVAFKGGKGENYSLEIGSNTFIPGFEEQVIGMSAGEEKDIDLTFPEDYHAEDLKGAKVTFKVKVNEVKQVVIPELDKEFFEDLGMEGIDSKESLEAQVKENITAQKEREAEDKYINDLLVEIAKTTEIDVPEAMINDELNRMVKEYAQHLQMQGISIDQFYKFANMTEDKLKEEYKESATKRVTDRLIIDAIMAKEKIEATDEEIDALALEYATKYQMTKEEFKNQFGIEVLNYEVKIKKVFELLKEGK